MVRSCPKSSLKAGITRVNVEPESSRRQGDDSQVANGPVRRFVTVDLTVHRCNRIHDSLTLEHFPVARQLRQAGGATCGVAPHAGGTVNVQWFPRQGDVLGKVWINRAVPVRLATHSPV